MEYMNEETGKKTKISARNWMTKWKLGEKLPIVSINVPDTVLLIMRLVDIIISMDKRIEALEDKHNG